ncbi:MAG: TIGR03435 family protein [Acidobacteriia bacterium]|nr:TIGR03435 family protein [Terriglobia bacterium]
MRLAALTFVALSALTGFSQTPPAEPRFEIADVHASGPALNSFTYVSGGLLRGDHYDLRKATLFDLIRMAYPVAPENIVGGPNWLEFDRFDIAARAPAESSPETVRRMLQALLAERFHLAVHTEMRPIPAYVLSLGKTKPKLTESAGEGDAECQWVREPSGAALVTYTCRNISMATFASRLRTAAGDYLKEPVIDNTGLEGNWDFTLRWSQRAQVLPDGAKRTTIADAVEKDLGLNLALRDAPAPVLVIDRADKPTPNAADIAQRLPARELTFEVATVRLNKTPQTLPFRVTRGGLQIPSAPLKTVLGFAWDMNTIHTSERFIGLPKDIDSVDVAIDARTTKDANAPGLEATAEVDDDLRAMTRALLTERFQMKWHYENRLMDGYSLVPAKPKLKRADPPNRAGCHEARTMAHDPRDTNPLLTTVISCRSVTIAQFASRLQQIDDHQFAYPVEDATGIEGTFDFDLSFTSARLLDRPMVRADGEAELNGAVSLAEALNKQLGLRLEKRKRILPAVVIDHMELTPAEN